MFRGQDLEAVRAVASSGSRKSSGTSGGSIARADCELEARAAAAQKAHGEASAREASARARERERSAMMWDDNQRRSRHDSYFVAVGTQASYGRARSLTSTR